MLKSLIKVLLIILALTLGIWIGAYILFNGEDIAENNIVKELVSPNGEYKAIAFIRDAGATTPFSPQVTILKMQEEFRNEGGNVFRGNRSEFIDIKWIDNLTLLIIHDMDKRYIIKQEKSIYNIDIVYEKIEN